MKRTLQIAAIMGLLVLPFLYGFETQSGISIQPTVLTTPESRWLSLGSITVAQAAPGDSARDFSAVWTDLTDANTIKWTVPNDVTGVFLRGLTTADADAHVVQMWVAAGSTYKDGTTEDSFMLGAILTLTGGKQIDPSGTDPNNFIDTLAVTASTGILSAGTVLDSGSDRVALYRVDLQGYKKVVFIATTLQASTTLKLDARWY